MLESVDWSDLKNVPWKELFQWAGEQFQKMKQKGVQNKELQKSLRKLSLEFYRNADLAREYAKTGVTNLFYSEDYRLVNCDSTWNYVSHNYSEELRLPIKLEHLIDQTYSKFKRGDNKQEDYLALAEVFQKYAEQYEEIAEWR